MVTQVLNLMSGVSCYQPVGFRPRHCARHLLEFLLSEVSSNPRSDVARFYYVGTLRQCLVGTVKIHGKNPDVTGQRQVTNHGLKLCHLAGNRPGAFWKDQSIEASLEKAPGVAQRLAKAPAPL